MEQGPVLVLTFVAQQVMVLRDAHGKIIDGGEVSPPSRELVSRSSVVVL